MTLLPAAALVLFGLAATTAVGWAAARFFASDLTRWEKIAWSLAAGLLIQCVLVLGILAFGARPGALAIGILDVALIRLSYFVRCPGPSGKMRAAPPSRTERAVLILLCAVAAAAWGLFLVEALASPMWATDYLAIWGLKGKVAFLTGSLPGRLFHDPALYWAHKEYPLLVPLSLAALAAFPHAWNDQALALLFPACELATLFALGGFLSRRVSPIAGAGSAALASVCLFLYRAVNAGTAEVPFALALVLVSCAFLDVLEERRPRALARLLVASLFCVSIKQEGTLFVLLLSAVLWARSRWHPVRAWRAGGWALLLPPVLHWSLLLLLRGPQTRRDFDLTLFEPHRWKELPALFLLVVGRMLGTEARQAAVPLAAIALLLLVTRRGIADPLLPVFAGQLLCYAIAFSVSSFDPIYAIEGAFRRIATTLFPAFTLVLCARAFGPAGVTRVETPSRDDPSTEPGGACPLPPSRHLPPEATGPFGP
jgi:hypothetical protein